MASTRCTSPRSCAPSCAGGSARPIRPTACGSDVHGMPAIHFDLERLTQGSSRGAIIAVAALAVGGVAASLWAAHGVAGLLGAALALVTLAIAVIDARLFIIPDELTAAALALALAN